MAFKLKINPQLKAMVPPLSPEDNESLDKSLESGQWLGYPLTAAPDGDVCDGMNRFEKLIKKGIQPKYVIDENLDTLEKKKLFVLQNVLARRHLNTWQKGKIGLEFMKLAQICAQAGQKTSEFVARKTGQKTRTFEQVMKIDKEAPPSIIKRLDEGKLSVDTAYKMITQKTRNLPKQPAPSGDFDVILCDVPIAFENETIRGAAANHYTTMTLEELKTFQVPSFQDCIMFFWIAPSVLIEGLEILRAWNFKYKTHFVWNKDKFGTGSWMRNQHETLIIAIKGKMPTPAKLFSSIINAERKEHSKKPEIYSMIEEMYPKRTYLELFSRSKDSRKGWTFHGNETQIKIGKNGKITAPSNQIPDTKFEIPSRVKKERKKKEITLACKDCHQIFHDKDKLKEHKEKFCTFKVQTALKPIDALRKSRQK